MRQIRAKVRLVHNHKVIKPGELFEADDYRAAKLVEAKHAEYTTAIAVPGIVLAGGKVQRGTAPPPSHKATAKPQ